MPKSSMARRTPSVLQRAAGWARFSSVSVISDALGHLERRAGRRVMPVSASTLAHLREQVAVRSSWRADTLTPIFSAPARCRRCQRDRLAAGLAQHPAAERHDQPGGLGERDELGRRRPARARGAASGPAPRPRRSARSQVDDAAGSAATNSSRSSADAQVGLQLEALAPGRRASSGRSTRSRPSPAALAWYMARSALRSSCSAVVASAVAGGDADAGRDVQLAAPPMTNGCARAPRRSARRSASASSRADVARAGRRTRRRRSGPRCRRPRTASRSRSATCDQQLVAGGVAEGVVDLLEAVQVEEQDGDVAGAARSVRARAPAGPGTAPGWPAR